MLLLPLLRPLWTALRQTVERVESRYKDWTRPNPYTLVETTAADLIRSKPELIAENALLRHQLIVLERHVKHPTIMPFDRGLLVVLASRVSHWKQALLIVKPDTLLK
jgi:putative transposase